MKQKLINVYIFKKKIYLNINKMIINKVRILR